MSEESVMMIECDKNGTAAREIAANEQRGMQKLPD